MCLTVRKAGKNDFPQILDVLNQKYPYVASRGPFTPEWLRERYQNTEADYYVALIYGRIVGVAGLNPFKGRLSHICTCGITVHPDHQKRGVGTRLMDKLIERAKKRGFKKFLVETIVENTPAVRMFKKLGFRVEAKLKNNFMLDDGKLTDLLIMSHFLDDRITRGKK